MKNENQWIVGAVIFLIVVSIANTIFLHMANETIAKQKIEILEAEQRVYNHLNTIAWDSTVSTNRQHVTGITRYYKCETVKKELEKYMK